MSLLLTCVIAAKEKEKRKRKTERETKEAYTLLVRDRLPFADVAEVVVVVVDADGDGNPSLKFSNSS